MEDSGNVTGRTAWFRFSRHGTDSPHPLPSLVPEPGCILSRTFLWSTVRTTIAEILSVCKTGGSMKKGMGLPCLFLGAAMAAAQTGSPVPAGTALMVKLETTLATFSNKAGDPFRGQLTQAVVLNGKTLIPAGAVVEGRVTKVAEPRRISGKPTIGILAETLIMPTGERFFLDATLVDTNAGRDTDVNRA